MRSIERRSDAQIGRRAKGVIRATADRFGVAIATGRLWEAFHNGPFATQTPASGSRRSLRWFGQAVHCHLVRSHSAFAIVADGFNRTSFRPKVLPAAKTYANDLLKPALTVGFCTFEGQRPVLAKTMRRCME
jgi:hypothetical protein